MIIIFLFAIKAAEDKINRNREKIKSLQTLALDTINRSNQRLGHLRGNITHMWKKVEMAKNILNSMQVSWWLVDRLVKQLNG